jgi:hypothetical protein
MKITKPLELKALYTIAELVKAAAHPVCFNTMRKMLVSNGIEFVRQGRSIYIPLTELQMKLPKVWESIVEVDRLRNKLLELEGVYVRGSVSTGKKGA